MERPKVQRLALVTSHDPVADACSGIPEPDAIRIRDADWSILMARGQDGDRHAYERLLIEITPYLRALARKWHKDPTVIEDTVQDILLTLHAIRHTYDPNRPFGPWLVGIANRRSIDNLRKRMRHARREVPLDESHDDLADARQVSQSILLNRDTLNCAIQSLPDRQKTAVNLLKIQGMSLAEASSKSGLSIGALKMAMHRALKGLRDMLNNREDR